MEPQMMLKLNCFIRNVVLLIKKNFIVHYANKTVYSNVFTLLTHTAFFTAALQTAVTFRIPTYDTAGTLGINFFFYQYLTVMLWLCTY